jgi:hypothetical protein
LIRNPTGIGGRGSHCRTAVRAGASITRSVIADPTEPERTRDLEERLRRSARIGGAAMPQDDELI